MCRMPRPSANAEGRFLFLTYAGKEDILNMLKVAQMAPARGLRTGTAGRVKIFSHFSLQALA